MLDCCLTQRGLKIAGLTELRFWSTKELFNVVGNRGKEDTFRPENWGRDVVPQPLQHPFTSLSSSVQTSLTSDTETSNINTKRWLEKIKKLARHAAHPLPKQNEDKGR